MKIQYCSDLHLEFLENRDFINEDSLKPVGDMLLLAGDIVPFLASNKYEYFFDYISANFQTTYWLPGNHEYYGYDLTKRTGSFREEIRSNIFLINNQVVDHGDVHLLFSTLWSQISPANDWVIQQSISDFHVIKTGNKKLTAFQFNQLHRECLKFLTEALKKQVLGKKIVITHHVPTLMNYPEKYKRDVLNEAFATELYDFIEIHKPDYWIYGHHHTNTPAFEIGNTQMLTNQLGYVRYNEHELFRADAVIHV